MRYEAALDERLAAGGFRGFRRLTLHIIREDGTASVKGCYDVANGFDGAIVAIYRQTANGIEVLLRHAPRVPLAFRNAPLLRPGDQIAAAFATELVGGMLEQSDASPAARAVEEAHEEAGLDLSRARIFSLGSATCPSPWLCGEMIHLFACDVTGLPVGAAPGDGTPFEEGATSKWCLLIDAIKRSRIEDNWNTVAEVALYRLRDHLRESR